MADARNCEQCSTLFEPLREHERFCSAACRIAWNDPGAGNRQSGKTALGWSVTAMTETAQRLAEARDLDLKHSLVLISEAVWWVTIVDATMIRYHREIYERTLAQLDPGGRQKIEGAFAGLRFVRNQMGYRIDPASFVGQRPQSRNGGDTPVAEWIWNSVPEPVPGQVPPRSRPWVASRYRQYQRHLVGRPVGEIIARGAGFLGSVYAATDDTTRTNSPNATRVPSSLPSDTALPPHPRTRP